MDQQPWLEKRGPAVAGKRPPGRAYTNLARDPARLGSQSAPTVGLGADCTSTCR